MNHERTIKTLQRENHSEQHPDSLVYKLRDKKRTQITHDDIASYVSQLLEPLRNSPSLTENSIVLIDELADELLVQEGVSQWRKFWMKTILQRHQTIAAEEQEYQELQKAELSRLRSAVLEEIRKQVTLDPKLAHVNYSNIHLLESRLQSKFRLARTANHTRTFHKDEHSFNDKTKSFRDNALRALFKLPPHPNILPYRYFDLKQSISVREYTKFRILYPYEGTMGLWEAYECLQAIVDAMYGALYLAQHKLVLTDIKPGNIARISVGKHEIGCLFDLEGLFPMLANIDIRLHVKGFLPPEVDPKEISPTDMTFVHPSEMVYQFGKTIEDVMMPSKDGPLSSELREQLQTLIIQMTAPVTPKDGEQERIKLDQAITKLQKIVLDLQRAYVAKHEG